MRREDLEKIDWGKSLPPPPEGAKPPKKSKNGKHLDFTDFSAKEKLEILRRQAMEKALEVLTDLFPEEDPPF